MVNKLKIITLTILVTLTIGTSSFGQQKSDTLVINVGKSKLVFVINDPKDLEEFEKYDLNEVLQNLKLKLSSDSTLVSEDNENNELNDTTIVVSNHDENTDNDSNRYRNTSITYKDGSKVRITSKPKKTKHLINFDLGMNNYLLDGKFPNETDEQFSVRPWGSWYVGINSIYQSRVSDRLSIEWGPGISWYNFKFEDDRTRIGELDGVTTFISDTDETKDYRKSKLTASFLNFSAVPVFQFGSTKRTSRITRSRDWNSIEINKVEGGFRMGVGGYTGFRLGSHTKVKYDGGDKDKDRDDFNLNTIRYGIRVQMGFRGTDLFFNYDLNELFSEGKGPKLNAFSFGIIL